MNGQKSTPDFLISLSQETDKEAEKYRQNTVSV